MSTLLRVLTEPADVLFGVLLIATVLMWRGRWRAARLLVTIIATALAGLIFIPVGALMLSPLEQRFPRSSTLPEDVDGIIVLGGAQQPYLSEAHGVAALNERAERLTTFLALARRYPEQSWLRAGVMVIPFDPGSVKPRRLECFCRNRAST